MRSNRLRGCLVVAALFAGTSSASAQDNTGEKTDEKTDQQTEQKADEKTEKLPAPVTVAQAEPSPGTAGPSPQTPNPGGRELTDDQLKKMIDDKVAAMHPKGPQLEFSGYFRGGVGLSIKGGKEVCFNLPGADTHWRLGNECDYVIEPQFTSHLVNLPDGSSWGVVAMPGLYRTWDDQSGNPSGRSLFNDVPTIWRQVYLFGENIPQLAGGRVWGGRRYYDRLHLDINDQFLEIHDSDGAGIEDMKIGPGKFSVAFLMNPNSESDPVPNPMMGGPALPSSNYAPFKLNLRYTDIPTVPEGALQIWAGWQGFSTSSDKKPGEENVVVPGPASVFRLGVYHQLNKVLGGSNFVGVKGEIGTNHQLIRGVVQEQIGFNNGHTQLDIIGEARTQKDRPTNDAAFATNSWASLGARVDTQIAGPFRFLLEAGIDHVFPAAGDDAQLIKTTACFAINAGDVPGARPEIRLFFTEGFWNDGAKALFASGAGGNRIAQMYGNVNSGGSVGLQAEAWWP